MVMHLPRLRPRVLGKEAVRADHSFDKANNAFMNKTIQ